MIRLGAIVTLVLGLVALPRALRAQQKPASEWMALFARAGLRATEHEIYELGPGGWGSVTGEPPVRYGERGPAASAVLCAELQG